MKYKRDKETHKVRRCVVCGGASLEKVIELGHHPLADTFLKKEKLHEVEKTYPLNCLLCNNCNHLQNEYILPPEERYSENDYSYTSSNSKISRDHWIEYCNTVSNYVRLTTFDHCVEFGSNDGFLLKQFSNRGINVTGIDPSPNIVELALQNGVYTILDFLSENSVNIALERHGPAKLVVGNNVFNHIADLKQAISDVKKLLKSDGYFVFEVPYLKDIIEKRAFDTIYHEHISYFTVKSLNFLFRKHRLPINNIEHNDYHGGSIRVYVSKQKSKYNPNIVSKYISDEEEAKLFEVETYRKFMDTIKRDKIKVLNIIYKLKNQGKRIAAIGAATKGNTLLNFYRLDGSTIDFITDTSELKIGKYTPGTHIPIVNDDELYTQNIDVALIIPWNIGAFLMEKIRKINNKIKFIVPGKGNIL